MPKKETKLELPEVQDKQESKPKPTGSVIPVNHIHKVKHAEEQKPVVPLRAFLSLEGSQWDQLAGFRYYASKNNLGPMTLADWRAALDEFKTLAV